MFAISLPVPHIGSLSSPHQTLKVCCRVQVGGGVGGPSLPSALLAPLFLIAWTLEDVTWALLPLLPLLPPLSPNKPGFDSLLSSLSAGPVEGKVSHGRLGIY